MNADGTPNIMALERLRRAFAEAIYHALRKVHNIGLGGTILDVPTTRQTFDYDCGAKALQTLFAYYGIDIRQDHLMEALKTNKVDGSSVEEVRRFAAKQGFRVKARHMMSMGDIRQHIDEGNPVLVLVQAWASRKLSPEEWRNNWDDGHYVLVIGYGKNRFVFEDPATFNRTWLTVQEFKDRWHDRNPRNGEALNRFGMVLTGKEPMGKNMVHME